MFIAVAAAAMAFTAIYTTVHHVQRTGHWPVEAIRAEYSRVGLPPGITPRGSMQTVIKSGLTSISSRYDGVRVEDVLPVYRQELTANGWTYVGDRHGPNFAEFYCKSKLMATVELIGATQYELSMDWSEISERSCP